MEKSKKNKIYEIHFRISEDEKKIFDKKAKKYPSKSALIIDAVRNFDERGGANKIDSLNRWANDFTVYNAEIKKIGNNINQLAHYFNSVNLQGLNPVTESSAEMVAEMLDEWNKMFKKMVKLQSDYTQSVIDI